MPRNRPVICSRKNKTVQNSTAAMGLAKEKQNCGSLMTSSEIGFPTHNPAATTERNQPDARCSITREKTQVGKINMKNCIIYSVTYRTGRELQESA